MLHVTLLGRFYSFTLRVAYGRKYVKTPKSVTCNIFCGHAARGLASSSGM